MLLKCENTHNQKVELLQEETLDLQDTSYTLLPSLLH